MKTIIFPFAFLVIATLTACSSEKVYICTGPQSKVYHKSDDCYGLTNCSGEIKRVTLSEAEDMGRRPCEICEE